MRFTKEQHAWTKNEYGVSIFVVPGRTVNYAAEGHNDLLVEHGPCNRGLNCDKIAAYLRHHPGAGLWKIVYGTGMTKNAVSFALTNHPQVFKVVGYERMYGKQSRLWALV